MDKILVTYTGGILSTNLAYKFLEENKLVYAPNNCPENLFSNITGLLRNQNYMLVDKNIEYNNLNTVDCIFYLDFLDTEGYCEDKYNYLINLIEKTKNMLSCTYQTGSKLMVVLPFCDYQDINKEFYEYYNLINFIIDLVNNYSKKYKINTQIVRICDIYGANSTVYSNNHIALQIYNALLNNTITTSNKRYYLMNASDVADILIAISNKLKTDSIIDIASVKPYLDSDITNYIINYTNSKSKIIEENLDAKPCYTPDLAYLNSLNIKYTTIDEGIKNTINFIRQIYFS